MIKTYLKSFVYLFLIFTATATAQNSFDSGVTDEIVSDTTLNNDLPYYTTAAIVYEIENTLRYIKDVDNKINSYKEVTSIETTFSDISGRTSKSVEDFNSYNPVNLSKYFLTNTRRGWTGNKSQLESWQQDISGRVQGLMEISKDIKNKEKMWARTMNLPENKILPANIIKRISAIQKDLEALQNKLFDVVGDLATLESGITDQIIQLDNSIGVIDDLYDNYRKNLFKATHPIIWKTKLKDTFQGTVKDGIEKAWSESALSIKGSLPSFKGNLFAFIFWSIIFSLVVLGLRFLYMRQKTADLRSGKKTLDELIIDRPALSMLFLVLFVFSLVFSNLPLSLMVLFHITTLVIAYFLLRSYFSAQGKKIILMFIALYVLYTFEIVWIQFGNYLHFYLLLEAGVGMFLISRILNPDYVDNTFSRKQYRYVIKYLRYPVFALYGISFLANFLGFQNLSVLLLKTSTQLSGSIIIFIGAWEILKSILQTLMEIISNIKFRTSEKYVPLLRKRLNLILNFILALAWLDILLGIVELDTPFYNGLNDVMHQERHMGSLMFSYQAIFQFILIMGITWALSSLIRIIFDEDNFKRSQRLRGMPAAVSTTLRLIIGMGGFFLALTGAGIDLTKISILVGAFGVGIGFGLQNIVNNFISGLILIYERPIQVSDTIEINNLLGVVKSIGIRSSNVRTFDGAEVVVPNSILVSDQLINWTLSDDKRRLEVVVGVKYGTDPKLIIKLLEEVADKHPLVAKFPKPAVLFNEFGDSSLNFRLLCWVLFENGIQTKSDISVAIDTAFKENNIEIPFPQMDLHVLDLPEKDSETQDES